MEKESRHATEFDDEIDLRDLLLPIWNSKYWIITLGIIFAMLILVYQIGGVAIDRSETMTAQVHFDFQGAESGEYPNGSQFSPQELLAGSVLNELYVQLQTEDFTYQALMEAVHITPSFSGTDELKNLISGLVGKEKGLSNKEFSSSVAEYTSTLEAYSTTYITLRLDMALVRGDVQLARHILTQIPKIWARNALNDRGVLLSTMPPISNLQKQDISNELLVKVNVLADTHESLMAHVDMLKSDVDNRTIVDPASGLSVTDITHKMNLEEKYRIAILKELVVKYGVGVDNVDWYRGFREARLGRLEREKDSLQRMVLVYEEALIQFSQQQGQNANNTGSQATGQGQASVYAPQYGEDVINTLLQLGSKMADPTYRKALLDEKIKLSTQLQKVVTEIEFYSASKDNDRKMDISVASISELIEQSFQELDKINQALTNITQVANKSRLDNEGALYNLVGDLEVSKSSKLGSGTTLKTTLAFLAGCMIATVIVLFRRLMAKK